MISVTVAAHGSKRIVGGHLKAYGSGRLSICDLDSKILSKRHTPKKAETYLVILINKIFELLSLLLRLCCPFIFHFFENKRSPHAEEAAFLLMKKNAKLLPSPTNKLNEKCLLHIFKYLNGRDVVACEATCKRWQRIVIRHDNQLEKIMKDQIRLLFDEGEVIVYPVDEKKFPIRYPMPNLQTLATRLRHLRTLSLFVRGLIPVEASPVLRSLCQLQLQPQQIYFIWNVFSIESIPLLEELIANNRSTVTDLGFEECSPSHLLSDRIFSPVVDRLNSLRVWNNGKSGHHIVGDETMLKLTRAYRDGSCLETVDMASCRVSSHAVVQLVRAWYENPHSDLSVSLNYCPSVERSDVYKTLAQRGIILRNGKIVKNSFVLTAYV